MNQTFFYKETCIKKSTFFHKEFNSFIHVACHSFNSFRQCIIKQVLFILCFICQFCQIKSYKGISSTTDTKSIVAACYCIIFPIKIFSEHFIICKTRFSHFQTCFNSQYCKIIRSHFFIIFQCQVRSHCIELSCSSHYHFPCLCFVRS